MKKLIQVIIEKLHGQEWFTQMVIWKYAANLLENNYAEVWYQQSCKANLLKSHFGMGVILLQIWRIFSEHIFKRTPLGGCFCFKIIIRVYSFSVLFIQMKSS